MIPSIFHTRAAAIIAAVKAQYPGCEDALAFDFGGGSTIGQVLRVNGVPPANTIVAIGHDQGATDYGLFSRAILPVGSGVLYHRYPKNNGNVQALAEDTNNINLPVTTNDIYDIVILNFGTTDAAKTITLTQNASAWAGRRLFVVVNKAATTGARAVTLVSNGAENTLVPIGGGTPTNSVILIAATTGAASRGLWLVGDSVYLHPIT